MKYHINNENEPKKCIAQDGNCRFGDDSKHYSKLEDARKESEYRLSNEYKNTMKSNAKNEDIVFRSFVEDAQKSLNVLNQMGTIDGKDFNQLNRFVHVKNVGKLEKFEELYNNIVTDVKNSDDFLLREPHDFIKEGKTRDISEVDYETVEKLENTTDIAYNSIVDKGNIFWKYNKKELYRDDNLISREKIIESLNESGQFDSEITTDYTELSYVNRSDGKVLAFEFFSDSVDDSDGKYIGSGITEFQSYELDSDTGEITPLYTQQINSDQEKMKDAIRSIVYWEKGVTRDNKKNNYY